MKPTTGIIIQTQGLNSLENKYALITRIFLSLRFGGGLSQDVHNNHRNRVENFFMYIYTSITLLPIHAIAYKTNLG